MRPNVHRPKPGVNPTAPDCERCSVRTRCFVECLPPELRDAVRSRIELRRFPRGALVMREGDLSTAGRMLRTGSVVTHRRGLDGRQRPVGFLPPGAPLALAAYLGMPNQVTVEAAGPVTTCDVPISLLRTAGAAHAQVDQQLRSIIMGRAETLSQWSHAVRVRGLVRQLAYSLLLMSDLQGDTALDLPSYTCWAALLGTRREALVRALRTLQAGKDLQLTGPRKCTIDRKKLLARLVDPRASAADRRT